MVPARYWWKDARIYELYIDKFAGDIRGLKDRLDYFVALDMNCLHILSHYPSPMVDDGYDITDYRGVRPDLGTLDDFKMLLDACHARGLRVIIEMPLNHTSNQHPWFVEASTSKNSPKRDYYLWRDTPDGFLGAANALPDIKSSNWIYNEATGDYYYATFYPQQPDLNWDNPAVFAEMMGHMEFWCAMGVDGFRLDAAPYLIKRANTGSRGLPETHQIIKNIRAQLEQKHPDVILLAEAAQHVDLTKMYFGNGDECHLAYNFSLAEQAWATLAFGDRAAFQAVVDASFADIPDNCQWVTFLRNHDEMSFVSPDMEDVARIVETYDPQHAYLFNGGTATAQRTATALRGDQARILEAFELLYSTPGAPVMYYGDEIGMQNLPLQDGIVDARKYVRGNFDWTEAQRQIADPDSLWHKTRKIIRRTMRS